MDEIEFKKGTHVCYDLETLNNTFNSVIVSIGAVKFTFEKGVFDSFYTNVDPKSGLDLGMTIGIQTIDWWKTQPKEARDAWKTNPIPLKDALNNFCDWFPKKTYVWVNGASFDFPILYTNLKAVKLETPWHYRKEMCMRTTFNLIGMNLSEIRKTRNSGVYHNALDDAKFQAECLIDAFK